MPTCTTGRHTWTDAASSDRCCNGWHQELRLDGPEPGDDPDGVVFVRNLPDAPRAAFVWVCDEQEPTEGGAWKMMRTTFG